MRVNVKIFPCSGRREVVKADTEDYKVYIKSVPENGKANRELVEILRKHFGCPVNIISGLASRKKVVRINNGN